MVQFTKMNASPITISQNQGVLWSLKKILGQILKFGKYGANKFLKNLKTKIKIKTF